MCGPEIVVCALDGGRHVELDARTFGPCHVGLTHRHFPRERTLPGEGDLLRQAEDVVVGPIDADWIRGVPHLVAERRIIQGSHTGRGGRRSGRPFSRRANLWILLAGLLQNRDQSEAPSGTLGAREGPCPNQEHRQDDSHGDSFRRASARLPQRPAPCPSSNWSISFGSTDCPRSSLSSKPDIRSFFISNSCCGAPFVWAACNWTRWLSARSSSTGAGVAPNDGTVAPATSRASAANAIVDERMVSLLRIGRVLLSVVRTPRPGDAAMRGQIRRLKRRETKFAGSA